ncbi:MAG TPA: hypothetical protein VK162_03380 [Streptosporangiaceae bacterium]|nr:hypothetical protein [Streptosporangiaceae bacterium]
MQETGERGNARDGGDGQPAQDHHRASVMTAPALKMTAAAAMTTAAAARPSPDEP